MVKYSLDALFSALSNETRRNILLQLCVKDLAINELTTTKSMSLAALSKHVSALEESFIVKKKKNGRSTILNLNKEAIIKMDTYIRDLTHALINRNS